MASCVQVAVVRDPLLALQCAVSLKENQQDCCLITNTINDEVYITIMTNLTSN
jgi:hypothetical protein